MRGRNKDNGEKQLLGRWGLWMGGLAGPPGDGDSRSREWGSMRKVLKQTNTERPRTHLYTIRNKAGRDVAN